MAIPVFNEGTMRYHDPDSGRMVKTPGNGAGAGSNLGASGSILEALNTHTLLLTDIKEGMFGTAAEQRDELIGREDTDIIDNYTYDTITRIHHHDSTTVINNEKVILKYSSSPIVTL